MLYPERWMNYTVIFNTTQAQMIIEDFTEKTPVIISVDYSLSPLSLVDLFS